MGMMKAGKTDCLSDVSLVEKTDNMMARLMDCSSGVSLVEMKMKADMMATMLDCSSELPDIPK